MNHTPSRHLAASMAAFVALLAACVCALALMPPAWAWAGSVVQVNASEQAELLKTARIGTYEGGLTSIYAEEDYPQATTFEYEDAYGITSSLSSGKIDYGFVPEDLARLLVQSDSGFSYLSAGVYEFDIRFGVAKGNNELLEKVNDAIAKLAQDGTLKAVETKWLEERDYTLEDVPTCDSGPVLRVAICASDEPLAFIQDGQLMGCDIELAMRIGYELGMRVEFQDMTFSSELTSVASGTADLAQHYAYSRERAESIAFTDALYTERWVALFYDDADVQLGPIESLQSSFIRTFVAESRWKMILEGLAVTVGIALASSVLGTLGGAFLCWLGRRGGVGAKFSRVYVRLVTGIPTLMWLLLLYYVVFKSADIPGAAVAVICLGLESSAPLSGVFQMGLSSVGRGQVEACEALGFSRGQALRHVVLPQALSRVWKLYSGQLTGLIKATSIVGYIAVTDLTKASDIIRARTYEALFPLACSALVYFAVIALFSWLLARLARRFDPKLRDRAHILKGIEPREG